MYELAEIYDILWWINVGVWSNVWSKMFFK
jgi:hypothetical protein